MSSFTTTDLLARTVYSIHTSDCCNATIVIHRNPFGMDEIPECPKCDRQLVEVKKERRVYVPRKTVYSLFPPSKKVYEAYYETFYDTVFIPKTP